MAIRIVLCEALTTATPTNGPSLGLQGKSIAQPFGGGASAKGKGFLPYEIVLTNTASTSTATIVVQESDDIAFGASSTVATLSFTSVTGPQTKKFVGKMTKVYIRVRCTAISGASITGYIIPRQN